MSKQKPRKQVLAQFNVPLNTQKIISETGLQTLH